MTYPNKITLVLIMAGFIFSACGATVKETVKDRPFEYIEAEAQPETVNETAEMTGSLWKEKGGLFADRRARNVNDIITVRIVEASSAKKKASTSTGRDTSMSGGVAALFGLEKSRIFNRNNNKFDPSAMIDITAGKSFDGTGETERSGNLTGTIASVVKEVYPNGMMRIEGRKVVTVNNEDQYIMLKGLVRPDDVSVDNVILSTKVAEAVIEYSGEGIIGREQKPGFITNFVDKVWPF